MAIPSPNEKKDHHPLDFHEDFRRTAKIYYTLIFLILAALILGVVIVLLNGNVRSARIIGASIPFLLIAVYLVHLRRFEWVAVFLAVVFMSLVTVVSTLGLGIHHIANLAYPAILIMAGLVTKKRTMIFLTLYNIACVAWLVFGEISKLYTPNVLVRSVPGDFFSVTVILILTAGMVRLLTESMFRNRLQLQKELRERRLAENSLLQFRKLMDETNDALYLIDPRTSRYIDFNRSAYEKLGYSREELSRLGAIDIAEHITDLEVWRERVSLVREKGGLIFESKYRRKDGTKFPTEVSARMLEYGEEMILVANVRDITERKKAESALRESEARLDAFFNQSLDGFFFNIFDTPQKWGDSIDKEKTLNHIFSTQRYTEVNNALLEQYGITREKFLSLTSRDFFAHDLQQGLHLRRQLFDMGHLRTETHERREDGTPAWFEGEYVCLYDNQKYITGFFGIQRDISKRKQADIEREQLIHELALKNAESETLREGFASIVGTLEFAEIIEHILDQIGRVVPFDSASVWRLEGMVQKLIASRNLPAENPIEEMEIKVNEINSAFPILRGEVPYILNHNVQAELLDFKDPPHNIINSWLAIPLKTRGKIIGLIALDGYRNNQFNDHHAGLAVTFANQVAIALENASLFSELQSELFTRENLIQELEIKNAELERFTYTVSHDLKSPLVTINGFLGYLKGDTVSGNSERVMLDIQRIQDAVDKMHVLLRELLELSRIGRIMNPPENISFEDLVNDALELVHGRLEARGVKVQIQPDLPAVQGDRQRLLEVLQNLIDNAAKYMGDRRDPLIEIGQLGEEDGRLIFFVKDNGMGISPQYHERIFGLFDKLDPKSEGTGVGLALVKRIMEVQGGRIWVESEVGKGAVFYFTLPKIQTAN